MNQDDKDIKYRFESSTFPFEYPKALKEYAEELDKHEECRSFHKIREDLDYIYRDPDRAKQESDTELEESSYYNWLTRFLNEQALKCFDNKIINKNLLFVPPKKAGTVKKGDFWNCSNPPGGVFRKDQAPEDFKELRQDPSKIMVYELNKDGKIESNIPQPYLKLSSDQLGFSAICGNHNSKNKNHFGENWEAFKNDKYPLHRYFGLTEGSDDAVNFLAQYIYDTRTLGGAFIWPTNDTEVDGDINCNYNRDRGVNYYIEDRADLTLLEVKCYYEDKEKDQLVLNATKGNEMYKFLKLFRCNDDEAPNKSFKNFVEFFMFNSFVVDEGGDFTPKNIRNERLDPFIFDGEKYNIDEPLCLSKVDLDAEGLMAILKRVRDMTLERTRAMEAIVCE